MSKLKLFILGLGFFVSTSIFAADFPALPVLKDSAGQTYSVSVQLLILMTSLSLLPAILLAMTSFTRILIVFGILRQAMGMPQTPSNQIVIGLSLFLSFFVMRPVLDTINTEALQPFMNEKISQETALAKANHTIKAFMLDQTRESDLELFHQLGSRPGQADSRDFNNIDSLPMSTLMPAFMTSELKTAFQIGFIIYIPFLIIDFVVASVLMAMGMMMLSPMMISLPFKIMLFVLIDGWALLLSSLAKSFGTLS